MVRQGCSVGYFTEYVPCDRTPRHDWCLDEEMREAFRRSVLALRRRKPIVLIQFPGDEYGQDRRCSAAGQASLHINAQGDVEPCPFVPVAAENIRRGGLTGACRSQFMRSIRERPQLLKQDKLACALFEHRDELETLGRRLGARPSD
jgi:MoaA/NifB/PqqE/SkfB family radical SAM enzyme